MLERERVGIRKEGRTEVGFTPYDIGRASI